MKQEDTESNYKINNNPDTRQLENLSQRWNKAFVNRDEMETKRNDDGKWKEDGGKRKKRKRRRRKRGGEGEEIGERGKRGSAQVVSQAVFQQLRFPPGTERTDWGILRVNSTPASLQVYNPQIVPRTWSPMPVGSIIITHLPLFAPGLPFSDLSSRYVRPPAPWGESIQYHCQLDQPWEQLGRTVWRPMDGWRSDGFTARHLSARNMNVPGFILCLFVQSMSMNSKACWVVWIAR